MVFSNIKVRVKRAGPSGLGDLEVTEYIAHIRSGTFEREDGASVHLATTSLVPRPFSYAHAREGKEGSGK